MHNKDQLQSALDKLKQEAGEWAYDIPLPFDIWTRGNLQLPHTRLKRVVQVVSDISNKPLSACKVLDLGCLDGIFSIEFAKHGAKTIGIEVREDNIKKAIFCKDALGLDNLEFRQDDVRNISTESYGVFDAIICSGILYHLPATDAINIINSMYDMVSRVIVIDTHIALNPTEYVEHNGEEYWGTLFQEHSEKSSSEQKAKALWASADNLTSFWFTRPSLVNILTKAGFSSVYECFTPAHINFGRPGLEHQNRCTFVAIKDDKCDIKTSPSANTLHENWPEQSLSYAPKSKLQMLYRKIMSRLK
jgi:2-polyprenyl-3-methyl-5-hydroxy-6-metoxy-1,4-benzoquinol methylase